MTEQRLTTNGGSARNVAVPLLSEKLGQSWPAMDAILRNVESLTLCLSAADLKAAIMSGSMQLWGLRDDHDYGTVAVSEITRSPHGSVCEIWLIATQIRLGNVIPMFVTDDGGSIDSLIEGIQRFAQNFDCYALKINAPPSCTNQITGRVTTVIIERDLRATKPT